MGLFKKLFHRNAKNEFTQVKEKAMTLSNQNQTIRQPSKADLEVFLNCLYEEDDQFLTLTLGHAIHHVRYVQAAHNGSDLIVQLGIEVKDYTKLVEKICHDVNECSNIFYQFYDYGTVENISDYQPVQFL